MKLSVKGLELVFQVVRLGRRLLKKANITEIASLIVDKTFYIVVKLPKLHLHVS